MFEKKTSQIQSSPQPGAKLEPYDIRVMPTKFHKFLAPRKTNWLRFLLIGVLVLIFVAAIGFGLYYFFVVLQPDNKAMNNINLPVVNKNNNQNGIINTVNGNINTEIVANLNGQVNINENANINLNINNAVNENNNLNANQNINAPTQPIEYIFSSQDSDSDNLTDIEEELYSTEKNIPDTDADGYLDGSEVIGLYNPRAGSGATLELSGLVNKYENPGYNYEIFYPAKWLAKPLDLSIKEVIFQSTEEYISVVVEDNPAQLALVNWYVAQSPDTDLNLLKKTITKNGIEALLSANKLAYYLFSDKTPDKIYVISYGLAERVKINFATTFEMMVNSFEIVPKL